MILYVIAMLQVASAQVAPQPSTAIDGAVLWRDFRRGISPDIFVANLRSVSGIKSAEAIRRRNRPSRIKIAYLSGNGLSIGSLNVAIDATFVNEALDSITLSETGCYSVMEAKLSELLKALGEKYPRTQTVKVEDSDGVAMDVQRAFLTDETRVTVSVLPIENPYPQHLYGGTGFIAAANKLANSVADSNYNSAIEACPTDRGRKATVQIVYSSQQDFAVKYAEEVARKAARAVSTRDGL